MESEEIISNLSSAILNDNSVLPTPVGPTKIKDFISVFLLYNIIVNCNHYSNYGKMLYNYLDLAECLKINFFLLLL